MVGLKSILHGFLPALAGVILYGSLLLAFPGEMMSHTNQPVDINQLSHPMTAASFSSDSGVFSSEGITGTFEVSLPLVNRANIWCGEITVDTTWTAAGSPYWISCDVIVPTGVTLSIEAGVTVQFQHIEDDLIISGTLQAVGTDIAPIHVQGRVAYMAGSSGVLDHTILEYGGSSNGIVYIASDAVQVLNSVVQYSANTGIYIQAASPLISATQILSNTGSIGCGLYNDSGSPSIQNNTFYGNHSRTEINFAFGGGLYNGSGSPIIQNNIFSRNHTIAMIHPAHGGGLYNDTGSPIIQGNIFSANETFFLGGCRYGCSGVNSAGGGIYSRSGSPIIQNNIISGNKSHLDYTYSNGGGLSIGGNPLIQNNTITGNSAYAGGGLYIATGSPTIRNNIVVSNTASPGGGIYNSSETPILDYNDVWNNDGGNYGNIIPGAHDISADPQFIDPANLDFHIASGSACIDAGDPVNYPPTDFEGDPRPQGPYSDIGADEYRGLHLAITATPAGASPGDPVTYHVTLSNRTTLSLTNVLLTDTLPVETAFTSYQAEGLTCSHDGAAWGGQLICALDNLFLAPGENRTVSITVILTGMLDAPQEVINPVLVSASGEGENFIVREQVHTWVSWCDVRLNDTPMGSNLQAAIYASTQVSDVVKVSGYCPAHGLNLSKTLILQGGWVLGFGECDPAVYTTTLTEQNLGRVIWVSGDVTPTIEGFVITGGSESDSGGISVSSGSPTIQNNTFTYNKAVIGGGLFIGSGTPIIQNNTFIHNDAVKGGGIFNGSGNPIIQNNTFLHNDAENGGGFYNEPGSPIIQNNIFTNNSAASGGGLFSKSGAPTIQNNTFTGNTSDGYGGGLHNDTGSPTIQGNTFTGNHSPSRGGGLSSISGNPVIQNNVFTNNSAVDYGGGLYIESQNPTIQNNTITGNSANGGGGLFNGNGSPTIQNNTFTGNLALEGGGLYNLFGRPNIRNNTITANYVESIGGGLKNHGGTPILRSNIVVSNTAQYGGGIYHAAGTTTLDYNDVWNNTGRDYYNVTPGVHDISLDPLLVDPANGDFHLAPGSPCIDAGDRLNYPHKDFEGDSRPMGVSPDIGADEFRDTVRTYLPLIQRRETNMYRENSSDTNWMEFGSPMICIIISKFALFTKNRRINGHAPVFSPVFRVLWFYG